MGRLVRHFVFIVYLLGSTQSNGHSGRTDKNGGHHDHQNGGYHYHNGHIGKERESKKSDRNVDSNILYIIVGAYLFIWITASILKQRKEFIADRIWEEEERIRQIPYEIKKYEEEINFFHETQRPEIRQAIENWKKELVRLLENQEKRKAKKK